MNSTIDLYGKKFAEKMTVGCDMRMANKMENDACFVYIVSGHHEVYSPNEKLRMDNKESVLMKCGNYVACSIGGTPMNPNESIVIHMDPEMIQKSFGDHRVEALIHKSQDGKSESALKISPNVLLDDFMRSLEVYFEHPELANDEILSVKLQELVIILIQENNEMIHYLLNNLYKRVDYEFENVIEKNVFNRLSIPEIAYLTNRSESTFKRDFRRYFGESPAKWIKQKRLEKAKNLLLNSDLSVSEITWDCGFESPSHFSTSFVKQYDVSPRNFRLAETERSLA